MLELISDQEQIKWLLKGDVSIRYQVYRDLLAENLEDLRERIATEGWGKAFLDCQNPDGHWGRSFYQPKWTSTHYTLLDLRNLEISPNHHRIGKTLQMIFASGNAGRMGVGPHPNIQVKFILNWNKMAGPAAGIRFGPFGY